MKNPLPLIVVLVLIVGATILGFSSMGTIDAGSVGVVTRFGATTGETKPAGFYTKSPFIESVIPMNTQVQKEQADTESSSADLQTVDTTISLNLSLDPTAASTVYKSIGVDYLDTIVRPAMQESVKATMAQYTAEQLITQREQVRDGISTLLASKLSPLGIKTEAINIVNFKFSDVFNQAIEAKVTAEQQALAAKNKLDQVKYEAEQNVARADGEAQAITIQAKAIQAQGGEAYIQKIAVDKWNGILPQFVGGNSPMPFISTAISTSGSTPAAQ
jgi:regulator of protease activity HflC (stomatin/prohibitin superfamily)